MADIGFTVIRIDDHTDDVMQAVQEKVVSALAQMGEIVEGHAKEDCPVDTGNLRNSLTHEAGEDDGAPCEYVGSDVEYAPYVEFIDRYHHEVGKAHFLRDAGENNKDELKAMAEFILGSY